MSNHLCPVNGCNYNSSSERGIKIHVGKSHRDYVLDEEEKDNSCPSCDEVFKTYKGMKTHHYHKHGESISGELVDCSNCGDSIRRRRNVVESQDLFFCDSDCVSAYNKTLAKEEHGSWRGGKELLKCDMCESEFKRKQSEASYYNKSFCNNDCYYKWKRENPPIGEDNPAWNGGHADDYGSNWREMRKKALKIDEYSCSVCGCSREEHYNNYDRDLDVHHKIPIAEFDKPEDANYLINLTTTCRSCHGKIDKISRREANRKPSISV